MKTAETTRTNATVGGFINETHDAEITNVFGEEIAAQVANAKPGETFLSILAAAGRI